jgi:hypothetical protein
MTRSPRFKVFSLNYDDADAFIVVADSLEQLPEVQGRTQCDVRRKYSIRSCHSLLLRPARLRPARLYEGEWIFVLRNCVAMDGRHPAARRCSLAHRLRCSDRGCYMSSFCALGCSADHHAA